jgi:20S proteasome alpha/beta subunit
MCIAGRRIVLLTQSLASGTVKKVIEINPYLLGTMAGGAGRRQLPFINQR